MASRGVAIAAVPGSPLTELNKHWVGVMDLAFLLATHSFDATPEDGYVIVKLDGMIYNLTPNGKKPGLSEVTVISN